MFDGIFAGIVSQILAWAGQYPVVASILMAIGVLRLVMKPLMSFLHALVDATPGTGDNVLLDNVEKNKFFQGFLYVLDWFASVKLPQAKK